MTKLRIGYFADGPWSHMAFERIVKNKDVEIAFIVPRSDTKDLTLKRYSEEYNIEYIENVRVNSDEFYQRAKSFDCDLFVSMSFNQIFRERIINLPRLRTINCHAGKLPFYRGRNILNWALINDEKEFGITVHFIDNGIDTGDIILQDVHRIDDSDDYSSLLNKAYVGCADILEKAIERFVRRDVHIIKQDSIHPIGMYCGARGEGDEILNWNQTSREIFNFIRAISTPGPQATIFIDNSVVRINSSRIIKDAPTYKGTPGQLIGKTADGFLVKTLDSFIEIFDISIDGNLKLKVGVKL